MSTSGNVQQSLQKIDELINGLQSEIEEERQPAIPLNLNTQKNTFLSPSPAEEKDRDPLSSTCDQKKVFQQFSGASLNDLVVAKQLTKNEQKPKQHSSMQCTEDTRTQPNSEQVNQDTHIGPSFMTPSHFGNNFSANNGSILKPTEHQVIKTAPRNKKGLIAQKDGDL